MAPIWFVVFVLVVPVIDSVEISDSPSQADISKLYSDLSTKLVDLKAEASATVQAVEEDSRIGYAVAEKMLRGMFFSIIDWTILEPHIKQAKDTEMLKLLQQKKTLVEKKPHLSPTERADLDSKLHYKTGAEFNSKVALMKMQLAMLRSQFVMMKKYSGNNDVIFNSEELISEIDSIKEFMNTKLANKHYELPKAYYVALQHWMNKRNPKIDPKILALEIQKLNEMDILYFDEVNKYAEDYKQELNRDINELIAKTANQVDSMDKKKHNDVEGSGEFR